MYLIFIDKQFDYHPIFYTFFNSINWQIRSVRIRFSVHKFMKSIIDRNVKIERIAIRNLLLLIFGYLASWIPYSLISLTIYLSLFKINSETAQHLSLYFGLLAKLSFIWISTFYLFSNKNLRIGGLSFR